MPIKLSYDDLTSAAPQAIESGGAMPAATGGNDVMGWLSKVKDLLQVVNEIIMNYKDVRTNIAGQPQAPANLPYQPPQISYVPPPDQPAASPSEPVTIDINAILIDKAKQFITQLQKMGFADATIEDLYNSFKGFKIRDIAGLIGVTNDTKSGK